MANSVHITLPDELQQEVEAAVANGEFASSADVILDALDEWRTQRFIEATGVDELRRLCQEGIDSGPGQFASFEQIIEEARRRFREA